MTRQNGVANKTFLYGKKWMPSPSVMRVFMAVRWSERIGKDHWKKVAFYQQEEEEEEEEEKKRSGRYTCRGRTRFNSLLKNGICENRLLWKQQTLNRWRNKTRMMMKFWNLFFCFIFYCHYCTKSILAAVGVTQIQRAGVASFSSVWPF